MGRIFYIFCYLSLQKPSITLKIRQSNDFIVDKMILPKLFLLFYIVPVGQVKSHELYTGVTQYSGTFTKLSSPGGIQECIEACNRNRKCRAFAWSPTGGCWVEDPGGNATVQSIAAGLMIMVKRESKCKGCPEGFVSLGLDGGCYYPVLDSRNWHDAEAACQELDPRAHLININDEKVGIKSLNEVDAKNLVKDHPCIYN